MALGKPQFIPGLRRDHRNLTRRESHLTGLPRSYRVYAEPSGGWRFSVPAKKSSSHNYDLLGPEAYQKERKILEEFWANPGKSVHPEDITGQRFGRLVAIERLDRTDASIWECQCDCGNKTQANLGGLKKGTIKSCGCLRSEKSRERLIERNGITLFDGKSIAEWSRETGISRGTIRGRIKRGWDIQKAVNTQPDEKFKKTGKLL